MKKDVIVVGELNADLIFQDIPSFPEMGKEKIARNMTLTMGSASAIFATNLARLGMQVGFIGMLGKDSLGDLVMDTLIRRGVDVTGIFVTDKVKTGITVVMSYPDEYAMLTYMGAMENFGLGDIDFDVLLEANHMHLSSYYLQPGLRPDCHELFRRCKEAGLTTSFDPGWDPEESWEDDIFEVLKNVDVMLPNEQEAKNITGKESLEDAVETLRSYSKTVVVTRGSKGAYGVSGNQTVKSKVFSVEVVDTTGSGDSFSTGFLYKWLQGSNLEECIKYGSACGAIATTKMGGSTASPSIEELNRFFKIHTENIIL